MKKDQKGFSFLIILLAFVVLGAISISGWFVYQARHTTEVDVGVKDSTSPYNTNSTKPLMTVTSSGGMCIKECEHASYNLYDDGRFEGHTKLSSSEVAELKSIIETTDFLKYSANPYPACQSFVDGFDQVLLFPQKYGDTSFTPCRLDIQDNDPAFSYIEEILESHYIRSN